MRLNATQQVQQYLLQFESLGQSSLRPKMIRYGFVSHSNILCSHGLTVCQVDTAKNSQGDAQCFVSGARHSATAPQDANGSTLVQEIPLSEKCAEM